MFIVNEKYNLVYISPSLHSLPMGKRLFGTYLYINYLKIKLDIKSHDNLSVCIVHTDFYFISVLSNKLELLISCAID